MTDSKEIPWKRLTAEGAAIVVSILLAFAIDAWWGERAEKVALVEYLKVIEAELIAGQENADLLIAATNEQVSAINRVLSVLASMDSDIHADSFRLDLGAALYWAAPIEGSHSSVQSFVNSETFGKVENAELISAINEFSASYTQVIQAIELEPSIYFREVIPILKTNADLSDLGWMEDPEYTEEVDEALLQTPESQFEIDESGMRSRSSWNAMFNWKLVLLDRARNWNSYKADSAALIRIIGAEIESLE